MAGEIQCFGNFFRAGLLLIGFILVLALALFVVGLMELQVLQIALSRLKEANWEIKGEMNKDD